LRTGRAFYKDLDKIAFLEEGQLMGHPLSFPLLCVINLAVYFHAIKLWYESGDFTEDRRRKANLLRSNVLVNGDDMLFMSPPDFFPFFQKVADDAGFKLSQGKNYCSPHTCMMNSQVFTVNSDSMKRVGYFNQKLLCKSSLKDGESLALPTQISREMSKMVSLSPWVNAAVPAVLSRWKKDFKGWFQPNWYLPVHLGGFGMDRQFGPPNISVSRTQRSIAAQFVKDPKLALYHMAGMTIPLKDLGNALANWKMVYGDYVPREGERLDVEDSWLAKLAYACRASQEDLAVKNRIIIPRLKPRCRLHPMSRDGIERYWNAQVFAFGLPVCPKMNTLPSRFAKVMQRH
jgi:hypothetical protein